MSVTSVRELFNGREGSSDPQRSTATRVFRVITNSAYDDDQSILASGMLPQRSSAHPRNSALFARGYRVEQENGAYIWKVTVTYDNDASPPPQLAKEIQPIPLMRRVKVRGKSVHTKEAMTKAPLVYTGSIALWNNGASATMTTTQSPLQSSSYEAFEGYEDDVDQFVWEVTWNVDRIPFWVQDLSNAINNAPVTILGITLPKWSLKLRGFHHSELLTEQVGLLSYDYYQVQFELHYKRDLWFRAIPDRGFFKLDTGEQKEILLNDGSKPVVPVPLDGSGNVLATPTMSNIVYRWYAPNPEKSFANLPIPTSPF